MIDGKECEAWPLNPEETQHVSQEGAPAVSLTSSIDFDMVNTSSQANEKVTFSVTKKFSSGDPENCQTIQEIICIAAAAAKSVEAKNSTNTSPVASPALNRAPSLSSTSNAASPAAQSFPIHPISFCRSAAVSANVFFAYSLQRFLEKRRDRLVSKNPYPTSDKKADVPSDNASIKEEYPTA
ncbi:unnamed protein product [Eruca vesicaria subsp. sativa]|uniref:Uncharacterized protein n=1 Tax=Eruca vesicaria subsp. sativa TaxID=29727 RepID=A0ABC8KP13_ERUVS|nr:unnamed protein product [Eruca vesicaria subsp. sativa]